MSEHGDEVRQQTSLLRGQLRMLLDATPDEADRASILYGLVEIAYETAKSRFPGGRGLSGREGDERDEVATVLAATTAHRDRAVCRHAEAGPKQ